MTPDKLENIIKCTKNLNILYIEDNISVQKQTTKMLESFFNKIYLANNGKEALELFEKASDEKDPYAQYYLGVMYINGEGVDKNDNKAKEYFKKSCDAKLEKACDELKKLK